MSLFTSQRERRLWIWTFAVVAAIFSTLGLAQRLSTVLDRRWFGVGPFLLGCLLVLAAAVTHGLKRRPGSMEIVVALGVAAAYLLVFVRMAVPTERSHLIEYGVVALFIFEALQERQLQGRGVRIPAGLAILLTTLIGLFDEILQFFIPNRFFGLEDVIFNLLAALMAVGASVALAWARRWTENLRSEGS